MIGSKELIASLPTHLGVGPGDLVVQPLLAYPTYEVGATLVGARVLAADSLTAIGPERPRILWLNSPSNPTGKVLPVDHLRKVVEWCRDRGVLLVSDECYLECAWETQPVSALHPSISGGSPEGILTVHSLSKRSNLAGYRCAFVAGDPTVVGELLAVRKNLGLIMPGPNQPSPRALGTPETTRPARLIAVAGAVALLAVSSAATAEAQTLTLDLGQGGGVTERALQLVALITVLALAPSVLVMVTSFTRIVVVLSLLRSAIGTQTAPPNAVIVSLALFLSAFVMAPTFTAAYRDGIEPLVAGRIQPAEAFERASGPFRLFMMRHVREKDLGLFVSLSPGARPEGPEQVGLQALVPAFMISELRRAFEIGFLLFVPFLIIDLVVASILMSVGMMMLPPVTVALPFKLIFFVLVDGWSLVAGSLVQSYGS